MEYPFAVGVIGDGSRRRQSSALSIIQSDVAADIRQLDAEDGRGARFRRQYLSGRGRAHPAGEVEGVARGADGVAVVAVGNVDGLAKGGRVLDFGVGY